MKIYRLQLDVNKYQSFFLEDEKLWESESFRTFDCSPKLEKWRSPKVYVLHPKLKRGHFFHLCSGSFVLDKVAAETLQDFLEMSGELLPLSYKGEMFYVLNVLECIDVLDEKKSQWDYYKNGERGRLLKYAFHPKRITETPLFKVPETCRVDILTVEGMKDPEDEFKYNVEQKGLKGLIFEEVWRDEN